MAASAAAAAEVADELLALQAIYGERLTVAATVVRLPLEARAVADVHGPPVTLDVVLRPTSAYPMEPPLISIEAVHGIDKAAVGTLLSTLHARSADAAGIPHLYDLLELTQEQLDAKAVPAGPCPVCLADLAPTPAAPVQRTLCYHLFHAACLLGAVRYQQERADERRAVLRARSLALAVEEDLAALVCPLCRVPLAPLDLGALETLVANATAMADAATEATEAPIEVPPAVVAEVARLRLTLERQRQAGGVIDLEENQRRLRVDASTFVQPVPPAHPVRGTAEAAGAGAAYAGKAGHTHRHGDRGAAASHHHPHRHRGGSGSGGGSGGGNSSNGGGASSDAPPHHPPPHHRHPPTQRAPRRPQAPPEQ